LDGERKLKRLLEEKIIDYYDSQNFKSILEIYSGASASVYCAHWKNTSTKIAIKKFIRNSNKEAISNEV
jgi:hypothetical protein